MGKLNGFIVVIATVFVLVNFGSGVIGDKIDAKIDIVTIITTPDETEIKKAYEKLPTYFEIGEKQAQLAIVSDVSGTGGGPGNVVINLVDDPNTYLKALKEWQVSKPKYGYSRIYAIDKIHWQVFVNRGDRAKVVVMIPTYSLHDAKLTEMVMQLLDSGVWLYVIPKNESGIVNEANDYTPDKKRLFVMTGNDVNFVDKMDGVKDAILDDLCNEWDKACRFTDDSRQKCEFHTWIKHINDPNQCSTTPPPTETCDNAGKCDMECDKRWPWNKTPDCTGQCGIEFHRNTSTPPPMMEHCAPVFHCPSCPTTTTTTTTQTTIPLETTTIETSPATSMGTANGTSGTSVETTETETETGPTQPETGSTETGTGPTKTETSPMETISTETGPTVEPGGSVPNGGSPSDEESMDLTWLWILLAVLGLLAVIAIIVGMVVMKKRSARKPIITKSTKSTEAAPATAKPPHVKTSSAKSVQSTSVGTPAVKTADHSVAADITVATDPSKIRGRSSVKK